MANAKIQQAANKKNYKKLEKFAQGRDMALRLEAIEAMGQFNSEEGFNYLTLMFRNEDAQVRGAAATGLGIMQNPKARAFIEHQLSQESDASAAQKMKDALAQLKNER